MLLFIFSFRTEDAQKRLFEVLMVEALFAVGDSPYPLKLTVWPFSAAAVISGHGTDYKDGGILFKHS